MFLETRKTPSKRLSQRAGDNTFFFSNVTICLLFAKIVKFLFQFTRMLWFTHKKCDGGVREPLGFATGLLFFLHKLDKLTGIRAKIWIWKAVLFQLIRNNRVRDFGIDHGQRFISFIRAGLFLEFFVQTKLSEMFIILSKMAGFRRFWPVFEVFFLIHCDVTT